MLMENPFRTPFYDALGYFFLNFWVVTFKEKTRKQADNKSGLVTTV